MHKPKFNFNRLVLSLVTLTVGLGITIALMGLLTAQAAPLNALLVQKVPATSDTVWISETVAVGYDSNSLALDKNGYPHISYYEDHPGYGLAYAFWDGSVWHSEMADTLFDDGDIVGYFNSLALDGNGYPHISHINVHENNLRYTTWDGSAWHSETVDTESRQGETSLALDGNGYPHISYPSFTGPKYAFWDGTAWITAMVNTRGFVNGTSLALDGNDYPHIISYEQLNGLEYAAWDGSAWITATVDTGDVDYPSLALDGNGYPRISYSTNNNLNYAAWDGSAWITETVDTESGLHRTSLALDGNGYPRISYSTNDNLKCAAWDGSAWIIEIVESSSSLGTSLALDGNDTPHISYVIYYPRSLKYATWGGTAGPQLTLDKSVSPSSAKPGEPITYTIAFSNTSETAATNVVITDTLSADLVAASYTSSGVTLTEVPGSRYVWTAPDLAEGEGAVIMITATLAEPLAAGTLSNEVTIAVSGTVKTVSVDLTVADVAPIADAGADQKVQIDSTVTLDGTGSSDGNGDTLTYAWTQTGGPTVTLSDATAAQPTFTAPDSDAELTFSLTVNDGTQDSTPDEVVITVSETVAYYFYLPIIVYDLP